MVPSDLHSDEVPGLPQVVDFEFPSEDPLDFIGGVRIWPQKQQIIYPCRDDLQFPIDPSNIEAMLNSNLLKTMFKQYFL